VKATDPEVKVEHRYVTNYYDTAIAKNSRNSMINDKKCDIIWAWLVSRANGAAEAAQESGKAWFIGVDSDRKQRLARNWRR
jgi:basic membrane protein A